MSTRPIWFPPDAILYFILEPGCTLVLEEGSTRLIVTVLNETRVVDGVETRVVEERESDEGRLVEISRNFFAIGRRTGDVFYFGEDVDIYKNGKIASHDGAWLSGVNGARFGLMMPGTPRLGARFYQEVAPGVAMDRAVIVSLTESRRVPAGSFTDVLKVEETTPLEPNAREFKVLRERRRTSSGRIAEARQIHDEIERRANYLRTPGSCCCSSRPCPRAA